MGFDVETAANGLQALIKASQHQPDVLVIDVHMPEVDGLSVLAYLLDIAKKSLHVMVVTGNPGQEIVERCEGFDASCIHKGHNFWNEFEARLTEIYPKRAVAIKQSGKRSAKIEVRRTPRVLLVDDDISVKKFFFSKFEKLGAELLYAADGMRGFWMARREEPTVIVFRLLHAERQRRISLDQIAERAGDQEHSGHCAERAAPQRLDQTKAAAGDLRSTGRGADFAEVLRRPGIIRSAAKTLWLRK